MKRSKLEIYVDILEVLAQKGPLKVTLIMYKANVNCKVLKEYLDFLVKQKLIEERMVGNGKEVYANTTYGTEVLKFFRELDKMLPLLEEENRILPHLG